MGLARWLLPFLWSAAKPDAGASQFWSRLQHFTPAHLFTFRHGVPLSRPKRPVAGPKIPCSIIWRLTLLRFVLGVLALSLADPVIPTHISSWLISKSDEYFIGDNQAGYRSDTELAPDLSPLKRGRLARR